MTATDELRRLLDELRKLACDINEEEIKSHSVITLNQGRYNRQFRLDMNHDWLNAWHAELERILQAIAATLGDVPRLPHFWTHDGALHVEATRMPTRIVVCEGGTCEFVPKRELDASEAENAKLREENQSIGLAAYELGRKSMAGENAKLWELVDYMTPIALYAASEQERDRMRELGVEVDA